MSTYIYKKKASGKSSLIFEPIISALIVFGIIYFIFLNLPCHQFLLFLPIEILLNIAPFGNNTIAIDDADIQYLDFFGFFKDVLNGENSINYSYSNYLGGGTIGVFSYYLASPVNFLVIF